MKVLFWFSLFVAFYTYVGYGILLFIIIKIKRLVKGRPALPVATDESLPTCTLVIAAYNEEDIISEKIENTLALAYPGGKLTICFVTDGSTDNTPDVIARFPQIKLMHQPGRAGKMVAMHRAMAEVVSDVTVFTDANTMLNTDALINICRHYANATVGAVAGEKRIQTGKSDDASAAGEGFYWKYESALKKWDSELYSVVGAAGELFSVRTRLYIPAPDDSIIDDFMISMYIARDGYRIIYEPEAYAIETASVNVSEELKRKVRIAAGGIQSILRLTPLLNIFKYPVLSFQYISHRVLRWTVTPFFMLLALFTNAIIVAAGGEFIYHIFLLGQMLFYLLAFLGWLLERRRVRIKALFVPYYFCVMNYAVLAGLLRYFRGRQSATWEKAQRRA